jgi:hypothetical protein
MTAGSISVIPARAVATGENDKTERLPLFVGRPLLVS